MLVFVNPGHAPNGIPDPGAVGSELRECDVALSVGEKVCEYLLKAGIETILLQDDDLGKICREANNAEADLFICIHCNAFNGIAKGTETLYVSQNGKELARCIQRQIVNALNTVDRGLVCRKDLYVLNGTDMTAAYVEMAFIDNEDDEYLLKTKQEDFARAIARGITDYERGF